MSMKDGEEPPIPPDEEEVVVPFTPLEALRRDIKESAAMMGRADARFMVDSYYQRQHERTRAAAQHRAGQEAGEPNKVVEWLARNTMTLENNITSVLSAITDTHEISRWARSIVGIGPVISAGLYAYIDLALTPHVSSLWRYAGQDPTSEWIGKKGAEEMLDDVTGRDRVITEMHLATLAVKTNRAPHRFREIVLHNYNKGKGLAEGETLDITKGFKKDAVLWALAKRPWNAGLKVLAWKIGESFVKVSSKPDDFYGKIYVARKAIETQKNENHEFADQAAAKLKKYRIGKSTDAYAAYSQGLLPPGHIHARAKRYAVKIFLSHYWRVLYEIETGKIPEDPWIIQYGGHRDIIPVPNWDDGGRAKIPSPK